MEIRLSDEKKPPGPKRDGERQTGLVLDERTRTKKPPMYKVLLHNDDYTTREFVVWVLQTVFHKNEGDAIAIMSHVHNLSLIHISEPTRQAEISYAVFCLKKKK